MLTNVTQATPSPTSIGSTPHSLVYVQATLLSTTITSPVVPSVTSALTTSCRPPGTRSGWSETGSVGSISLEILVKVTVAPFSRETFEYVSSWLMTMSSPEVSNSMSWTEMIVIFDWSWRVIVCNSASVSDRSLSFVLNLTVSRRRRTAGVVVPMKQKVCPMPGLGLTVSTLQS